MCLKNGLAKGTSFLCKSGCISPGGMTPEEVAEASRLSGRAGRGPERTPSSLRASRGTSSPSCLELPEQLGGLGDGEAQGLEPSTR